MKEVFLFTVLLLLIGVNLYAADGDLIVEGNVGIGTTTTPSDKLHVVGDITLGNGTDTPRYIKFNRAATDHKFGYDDTIGLWNSPGFYLSDSIYVNKTSNFSGYYLGPNGQYGGFVKKNAYPFPLISSHTVFLGDDGESIQIAGDTIWDVEWGYCEGVSNSNARLPLVNCANYAGTMDSNDFYWVWKHGFPGNNESWCTGDCRERRRDLKFLFDGESNDGVMGYMEDEDAFYFNEKLGIGTTNPSEKLEVAGAIKIADTASSCTQPNEGTIKYVRPYFYGCNGTSWVKLSNNKK